jgi:hypothetical protein
MLFIQLAQQELIAIASKVPIIAVASLVIAITVKLSCFTSFTIALVVIVKRIAIITIA